MSVGKRHVPKNEYIDKTNGPSTHIFKVNVLFMDRASGDLVVTVDTFPFVGLRMIYTLININQEETKRPQNNIRYVRPKSERGALERA